MNSSMECSIKSQKVEAMKKYKRAKFVYNLVLYSLTSFITCFFFTYPFWLPSMNSLLSWDYLLNQLLSCDLLGNIMSFLFDTKCSFAMGTKCSFAMGNLIVLVLIWEAKMKGSSASSSPASDIYDEYVARSRQNYNHQLKYLKETNGLPPTLSFTTEKNHGNGEERNHGEEKNMKKIKKGKKELKLCKSMAGSHEERRKGMRSCKSESELVKRGKTTSEGEIVKREQTMGVEEGAKGCMPTEDELNKRVEAFIARINEQRLQEAKSVENGRG